MTLNRYLDLDLDIEIGHCYWAVIKSSNEKLSEPIEKYLMKQRVTDMVDSGVHDLLFKMHQSEELKMLSRSENVV